MKKKLKTIDDVCNQPNGSFQQSLGEHREILANEEKARATRIRNVKRPTYIEPECDKCGRVYCDCESKY
jgi:hypothetical protein